MEKGNYSMKMIVCLLLAGCIGCTIPLGITPPAYAASPDPVQSDSAVTEPNLRQGWLYFGKANYDKAIQKFTAVLAADPANAGALKLRGLSYSFEKKYDQAIADYTTVLSLYNNTAGDDAQGIYYDRALAYMELEKYDQAIADLTQALTYPVAMKPLYLERANAYASQKNYDQALADYKKQLELFPDDIKAYEKQAAIYQDAPYKNYTAAIANYDHILALQPDNINAHIHRYQAFLQQEDYPSALADIETVLAANKKNTAVYTPHYNKTKKRWMISIRLSL